MDLPHELSDTLQELGEGFLQEFLEVELGRHPGNLEALAELGQIYTRRRLYGRGLAVDRRLVELLPHDPTAHYNLACSLALLGRTPQALASLEDAVERGYGDAAFMAQDDDLASLRGEARFRALIERIRSRGAED